MCGDSSQNRGALEEGCLVEGVKRGPSECWNVLDQDLSGGDIGVLVGKVH